MKAFKILMLALVQATCLSAAVPTGYYDRANGQKKVGLKQAIRAITCQASVLQYGSGAGKTWTGFYSTDRLADNQVLDRYSYEKHYFYATSTASAASAPTGMNIEHSFPKSWWGGTENQAYKDLFNLMPSEQKINSSKSNYAMGKVTTVTTTNGCTKVGKGQAGSKTASLWEPADEWKGDFARSYFYMVTAYSNLTWEGEGLTMLQNDEWPTLQEWAYELLLEWSRQDPVDDIEIRRNDAVYQIQGNRNPFVDYPNLAEYIWGDSTEYAFSVEGSTAGGSDQPDPGTLVAYEANEIVSSLYSCRFDANWSKFKEGAVYTLDVYTYPQGTGQRVSLPGYPVKTRNSTYRVTEVRPNTSYWYTVYVYEDDECVATSNEVRVDMPEVGAIFAASVDYVNLVAKLGMPSDAQQVTLTMEAVPERRALVTVEAPFEVSIDGEAWTSAVELTDETSLSFYVRLGASAEEGDHQAIMRISSSSLSDIEIPLVGSVSELMAFFENFESGSKGAYAAAEVRCSAASWYMDNALIGKDQNANDMMAARIKGGGSIMMTEDKAMGCDSLWFYAAPYNTDANMAVTVRYSLDGGDTWDTVVEKLGVNSWRRYGYKINQPGNIRLRIEAVGAKRINVDDIQMSDYGSSSSAVDDLSQEPARPVVIYDLAGRMVSGIMSPGIYIVNGRKVIVR